MRIFAALHAQINRDYENSSIPSSKTIRHKKITNSREKTGRKQGAQTGHKHHGRKKQTPTGPVITLMPSQEILEDPDFKPAGKFITKQLVSIELCLHVQEYTAEIYRNSKTGERVHGALHDHESTFYKYGSDHQECLAHILRYLKDSMENEKNLTWSTKMHSFIQEIIHYRNSRESATAIDAKKTGVLIKK